MKRLLLRWIVLLLCVFNFPFVTADATYTPQPWRTVRSSWYGPGFVNRPMANGAPFRPYAYTVASRTLRLGRKVLLRRGEYVVLATVTDRGPYIHGRDLDVSEGLAGVLGFRELGVAMIDLMVLEHEL